MAEELAMLADR